MKGSEALAELYLMGFSKDDIAGVAGTTTSQLREWQQVGIFPPDVEVSMSLLLAFCHVMINDYGTPDPADWFEYPIPGDPGCIRPMDLWLLGHRDLVREYAKGRCSSADVVDQFRSPYHVGKKECAHPLMVGESLNYGDRLVSRQIADDLAVALIWLAEVLDIEPANELWEPWQEHVAPALAKYADRVARLTSASV